LNLRQALADWGLSWRGWFDHRHGEWWLLAQLLLVALLVLLPPWPAPGSMGFAWPLALFLAGWVLVLIALVLAVQALWWLGPSLTPLPDPKPGAPLITSGAYGRCRHPLYQALVLAGLGLALAWPSPLHLLLTLVLAAVLVGKAHREERLLIERHPAYAAYRAATPAILPHVPGLDWRR
jgi:protein-S-isoprenylcysteine O-methyltransferase Ste14